MAFLLAPQTPPFSHPDVQCKAIRRVEMAPTGAGGGLEGLGGDRARSHRGRWQQGCEIGCSPAGAAGMGWKCCWAGREVRQGPRPFSCGPHASPFLLPSQVGPLSFLTPSSPFSPSSPSLSSPSPSSPSPSSPCFSSSPSLSYYSFPPSPSPFSPFSPFSQFLPIPFFLFPISVFPIHFLSFLLPLLLLLTHSLLPLLPLSPQPPPSPSSGTEQVPLPTSWRFGFTQLTLVPIW